MSELLQHKDASKLTPEQQTALFVTNMFDKTLTDKTGKIKLTGEGDKLLKGIFKNNVNSMKEAYRRLHYAGKFDKKTRDLINRKFK